MDLLANIDFAPSDSIITNSKPEEYIIRIKAKLSLRGEAFILTIYCEGLEEAMILSLNPTSAIGNEQTGKFPMEQDTTRHASREVSMISNPGPKRCL